MRAIITLESLKEAGACYLDEPECEQWLQKLLPPAGLPVTAASVELARAAGIPDDDIFWALNFGCPEVTDSQRRLVACDCARRALEAERAAGREPDVRSWRAVEVAERFARGAATGQELEEARASAEEAARVAWARAERTESAAWAARAAAWEAEEAARVAWARAESAARAAWAAEEEAETAALEEEERAAEAEVMAWRFAVDEFVRIINQEGTN